MKISNLTKTESAVSLKDFEAIWCRISNDVAESFRMPEDEKQRFKDKAIARLIAAIPLMAGCENAERTAVSHLGTYILSNRETKHYYNPSISDNKSILERLRLISTFRGGNSDIINKGMALIALSMLFDYKRDVYVDETLGKYNPVAENVFHFNTQKKALEKIIQSTECKELDALFHDEDIRGYWGH